MFIHFSQQITMIITMKSPFIVVKSHETTIFHGNFPYTSHVWPKILSAQEAESLAQTFHSQQQAAERRAEELNATIQRCA